MEWESEWMGWSRRVRGGVEQEGERRWSGKVEREDGAGE